MRRAIGRRSPHAVIERHDMELVGVYVHGGDKVGRDAAELCERSQPTGVKATDSIDELLAHEAAYYAQHQRPAAG